LKRYNNLKSTAEAVKKGGGVNNIGLVLLIFGGIVALGIVLIVLFIPIMSLFNSFADRRYKADEKSLLTGKLLLGIDHAADTGEVLADFVNESRKTLPAKLYAPENQTFSALEKGTSVLIIEVINGVAYVIPNKNQI
jgi:hypothetical protein